MYPLTTPQQNMWNLRKYYPGTSITNICCSILFQEFMKDDVLKEAIKVMVKAQGGLRLHFQETRGIPEQEERAYKEFEIKSFSFHSYEEMKEFAKAYAKVPFLLEENNLFRFAVIHVEDQSGILFCVDHLIADAWTINIMANQVYRAYQMLMDDHSAELEEYSYLNVIKAEEAYCSSGRFQKDREFWQSRYSMMPEISSICPDRNISAAAEAGRLTVKADSELTSLICRYEEEHRCSPAIIFEAAVSVYMARINRDTKNTSFGTIILNRAARWEKHTAGMFVSTIPMSIECGLEKTVREVFTDLQSMHSRVFRHQKYPYSLIVEDLRQKFQDSPSLYNVIISYQNAVTNVPARTEWYSNGYCEVPLEIHIDDRDQTDSLTLNFDYQTGVFSEGEIHRLSQRILFLVQQMLTNDQITVSDLFLVTPEESEMLINTFNDTREDFAEEKCFPELFAEQAAKYADQEILVFEGEGFTYRQLDRMSNSLAHFLRKKGVGPGVVVPIISRRSWHIIAAMLGIMKAGGAFMPVDPAYPDDRIKYMFETANCSLALAFDCDIHLNVDVINLESFDYESDVRPLASVNQPEDLCYVIFTSGSTGKPKGVSIMHRNVSNYCTDNSKNVCHSIMRGRQDTCVSVTNTIFDIFISESLLPLLNGIKICFANDEQTVSQKKLAEMIDTCENCVMQITPTKMRNFIRDKENTGYLHKIRAIALGGESFQKDLYSELRNLTDAKIFNIYGPAETTVWATRQEIVNPDDITVGKPLANTQVYILDKQRRLLPVGVSGELYIAGACVGRGYLNRPDLTEERFISNPFATEKNGHGKNMYAAGDLARWREDGNIEFLGRIDTQVKIRGLRIELAEIESIMAEYPGVQLVAVADQRDKNGRQYLAGYYTSEESIDEKKLREHMAKSLPRYMLPNYFVHLESMPMTAGGKTDRKKLPLPDFKITASEYAAPSCQIEEILCSVLKEIFETERIGIDDDFFYIGGDSLRAIEYAAKAHSAGIEIALQDVFDYPTVRSMREHVESGVRQGVCYKTENFAKYNELLKGNVIDDTWKPHKKELGNIVLTGATGFLGAHVLEKLLSMETGDIYCIVRGNTERLASTLDYYFDDNCKKEAGKRIHCIEGDITDKDLERKIPEDIQTIIHTAATVKHFGPYSDFETINVKGTKNMALTARKRAAAFIHISTMSVSGVDSAYKGREIEFDERSIYKEQPLDNVYVRSKFEAECCVLDEMRRGLDAKIVRVGNLTNRTKDYKFQPNYKTNAFLTRMKAVEELGLLPDYLMKTPVEFSPVDQTAEGIVKIAQYAGRQTVFHLHNPKGILFEKMAQIFKETGSMMEVLPGDEFNRRLQSLVNERDTRHIYEAFQNDLDEKGNLTYKNTICVRNQFTDWFMHKTGFEWIDIEKDYFSGYVRYFRGLGYFRTRLRVSRVGCGK